MNKFYSLFCLVCVSLSPFYVYFGCNFNSPATTTVGVTPISCQASTPPQQDASVTASPIAMATENISSTSLPTLFAQVQRPHPPSGIALLKCLGSVADNVVNEFNLQVNIIQILYITVQSMLT